MRYWLGGVAMLSLTGLLLAGCESDTNSRGLASVTITDEEEQAVAGNLCAIKGHATNGGNRRARVKLAYDAKNSQGTTTGTSTGEFEVAPLSNFDFRNSVLNNLGQPSSTVFTNNLSCAAIDHFRRTDLEVEVL
jgi:uncharacterized protein (DUF58 family)